MTQALEAGRLFINGRAAMAVTGVAVSQLGVVYEIYPNTRDEGNDEVQRFAAQLFGTLTGGTNPILEMFILGSNDGTNWQAIAAAPATLTTGQMTYLVDVDYVPRYIAAAARYSFGVAGTFNCAISLLSNGAYGWQDRSATLTANLTDVATIGAAVSVTDLVQKPNVRLATAAALPAYTRTANVLLANANGALANIDGVAGAAGDRILLQNGAAGVDNGIYVINSLGGAAAKWQMTRATDMDSTADMASGVKVTVMLGTVNALKQYVMTNAPAPTINVTALTFVDGGSVNDLLVGTIAAMASTTTTIAIANAKTTDYCWASLNGDDTGGTLGALIADVSGAGVVTIVSQNATTTGDAVVQVFVKREP